MKRLKFLVLVLALTLVVGTAFFVVVSGSVGLRPEDLKRQQLVLSQSNKLPEQNNQQIEDNINIKTIESEVSEESLAETKDKEDKPDDQAAQPEHAIKVLPVPFMVQAPYANWEMPYQEACEEASIIMVAEYLQGNKNMRLTAEQADKSILELVEWGKNKGYQVDLTAAEVVMILADKYQIKAQAVPYNPEIIKQEINAKRPVIIPAAGQELGNPYFTQPGPLYHMLVIKGYEADEFIVNDPGTKRGESYRYSQSALAGAVHDWNGGIVSQGDSLMIILK